jgi:hypothetical protein
VVAGTQRSSQKDHLRDRSHPYPFGAVENEAAAVPGYVNRPTGHVPEQRTDLRARGRYQGRRPSMRIARVALRAYEQRAERRAWMRSWLAAQLASAPAR